MLVSRTPYWGLVQQRGPWKESALDRARLHQRYNPGIGPIGGTKHAGHDNWKVVEKPVRLVDGKPAKRSKYANDSVVVTQPPLRRDKDIVGYGRLSYEGPKAKLGFENSEGKQPKEEYRHYQQTGPQNPDDTQPTISAENAMPDMVSESSVGSGPAFSSGNGYDGIPEAVFKTSKEDVKYSNFGYSAHDPNFRVSTFKIPDFQNSFDFSEAETADFSPILHKELDALSPTPSLYEMLSTSRNSASKQISYHEPPLSSTHNSKHADFTPAPVHYPKLDHPYDAITLPVSNLSNNNPFYRDISPLVRMTANPVVHHPPNTPNASADVISSFSFTPSPSGTSSSSSSRSKASVVPGRLRPGPGHYYESSAESNNSSEYLPFKPKGKPRGKSRGKSRGK